MNSSSADGLSARLCTICLNTVVDDNSRGKAQLVCGHLFHLDCIGSEFNYRNEMKCPNCRVVESGNWLIPDEDADDDDEISMQVVTNQRRRLDLHIYSHGGRARDLVSSEEDTSPMIFPTVHYHNHNHHHHHMSNISLPGGATAVVYDRDPFGNTMLRTFGNSRPQGSDVGRRARVDHVMLPDRSSSRPNFGNMRTNYRGAPTLHHLNSAAPAVVNMAPHHLNSAAPAVVNMAPHHLNSAAPAVVNMAPHHLNSAASAVVNMAPHNLNSAAPAVVNMAPHHLNSAAPVVVNMAPHHLNSAAPTVVNMAPHHLNSAAPTVVSMAPHHLNSAAPTMLSMARSMQQRHEQNAGLVQMNMAGYNLNDDPSLDLTLNTNPNEGRSNEELQPGTHEAQLPHGAPGERNWFQPLD